MADKVKEFNIVIVGTGGQGLITMLKILSEAALLQGFDVKTSELHGLSQRGGSVECHIRFGTSTRLSVNNKIYSPLVRAGGADLIIAIEQNEALRACYYGSKQKTIFLVNKLSIFSAASTGKVSSIDKISKDIKKFSKKLIILDASEIVKKEVGSIVTTGVYMLGYSIHNNLLPLKEKFVLQAIAKTVKGKYLELNKKVFKLPLKIIN